MAQLYVLDSDLTAQKVEDVGANAGTFARESAPVVCQTAMMYCMCA